MLKNLHQPVFLPMYVVNVTESNCELFKAKAIRSLQSEALFCKFNERLLQL